jgi:hypothetical protein
LISLWKKPQWPPLASGSDDIKRAALAPQNGHTSAGVVV